MSRRTDNELVRIGETVRQLRIAFGWTSSGLADAVGVSRSYLSNVEAGRRGMNPSTTRSVAEHLGVPLAAITTDFSPHEIDGSQVGDVRFLSDDRNGGAPRDEQDMGLHDLRTDDIARSGSVRDGGRGLDLDQLGPVTDRLKSIEELLRTLCGHIVGVTVVNDLGHGASPSSMRGASSVGERAGAGDSSAVPGTGSGHFSFYAAPEPFSTRHGDTYIGPGVAADGTTSVAIVGPGDESTDIHLSWQQAVDAANALLASAAILRKREHNS